MISPSAPAPPSHHHWVFKNLRTLTVASLLHKPEFAGGPVSRQSDYIEVLSSCGGEREQKESLQKNQMNALLSRLSKQRHSQANWEYIQTLSLCVGGLVLNVWGATCLLRNEELVRERHERIVKGRFLSVNSTHSFPWRAASSPPWPCPVYCPPRSFCGTSDSRTCEAYTSDNSMYIKAIRSVCVWSAKIHTRASERIHPKDALRSLFLVIYSVHVALR